MHPDLINRITEMMKRAGPFTDYQKDEEVLKQVIDWAGDDFIRWRVLLNFTHDQGMICAYTLVQYKTERLIESPTYRTQEVYLQDLKGNE